MDVGVIVLGSIIIVAIAVFAAWYQRQPDDVEENDIDQNEMDVGLDDRLREMLNPETDNDPYGEIESDPYCANLVNKENNTRSRSTCGHTSK